MVSLYLCAHTCADNKVVTAVEEEREKAFVLKRKLEEAEAAAREAAAAARAAAEGEAKGRRAAGDLAELAREQKVPMRAVFVSVLKRGSRCWCVRC